MAATATRGKATPKVKRGPGRPRKHPIADSTVAALTKVAENVTAKAQYSFQNFALSIKIGNRKEMNLKADDIDTLVDLFQMIGDDEYMMLKQLRDTYATWDAVTKPGFKLAFTVTQGNLSVSVSAEKRVVK